MKFYILLIALSVIFVAQAQAVTRYISPTGSNSNSCASSVSSSTPKQTFNGATGAVACMAGGDTLIIMGGTYAKFIDRDSTGSIPNGSAGAPTTFTVRSGDTVTTTTSTTFPPIEFLNGAGKSYITIDGGVNCGANSNGAACKLIIDGTGVSATELVYMGTGNDHIIVTNFEARNSPNNGSQIRGTFLTFSNCNIHHNGDNSSPSSAYGIYQAAGEDTMVENCLVHHNGGYGIHLNADSNADGSPPTTPDHLVKRAKFRYNDIYANGQYATIENAGLLLGGFSEDVEAYGNIIHDNINSAGGIQFNYFRTTRRPKVYNNTVTRNSQFGIQVYNAQNAILTNNLIGNNNGSGSGAVNVDTYYQGSGNSFTTNSCFGTGGTNSAGGASSNACNLAVTPNFVNAAGGNFKLQAGSPGLNVGTTLASPYNSDMFGTPRPVGAFDLGALEYAAPVTTTPQLVLALPLDEGGGTIATDVSGQKNNATLVGAKWDSSGKYDKAIILDGSGYLTVAPAASLALAPGMTLEAWIYPTAAFTGFAAVIRQDRYFLYAASDLGYCPAVTFAPFGGYATTGNQYICATSVPPVNTWSHLAVTQDGLTLTFYLNGSIVATQTSTDPMVSGSSELRIGASQFGEYFTGKIDQPMVYNYPRTQAQIVSDMNTPLIGAPGKLVDIAAPASVEISSASSIEISAD